MDFNLIKFCMAFFAVLSIIGFIDIAFVRQKLDNINVLNLKSKLLIIISGLYSIRPVIQNFVYTFSSPIEAKKACLKMGKKSSLIICVRCIHIIFLISFSYAVFKGPKHLTSRNWRIWNKWKSIQRVIIFISLQ